MAKQSGDIDTRGGARGRADGLVVICNVIANRGVPIVFILVSSLIIANISCDQVGSSNDLDIGPIAVSDGFESSLASSAATAAVTTSSSGAGAGNGGANGSVEKAAAAAAAKYDPLNMLREIYLDQNSKVITFLSSPAGNSVQKFHPNGRYGRRSVDNFAEAPDAHSELATLRFGGGDGIEESDPAAPMRSLLQMDDPTATWNRQQQQLDLATSGDADTKLQQQRDHSLRRLLANINKNNTKPRRKQQSTSIKPVDLWSSLSSSSTSPSADGSNAGFRQELNKLLKCNYSGVSNLFWCDS